MKKLAIIEMDIRTCRMIIVEYTEKALINIKEDIIEPINLWCDIEQDNVIKPARTQEILQLLKSFKKTMELKGVEEVVGYSTQILKTVKNHRSFIEELHNATGIRFDVLSDDELYKSIHLANAYTIDPIKANVIYIENESTHFLKYNRRNILESCSFDFGPYTIAKLFEESELNPEEKMQKMVEFAKEQFGKSDFFKCEEDDEFKIIGMGRSFDIAGKLCRMGTRSALNLEHNYKLSETSFEKAYNFVRVLDVSKAQRIKGLNEERADVIFGGVAIIKALFDNFELEKINVNECGIINGAVYKEMNGIFGYKPIGDIMLQSLESCNYFNDKEEYNCVALSELALDLFEELKVLHRFSKPQRRILKIASYFAYSGKRISSYHFERNSFQILLNSNIYGATQKEILVAAFVCASQNLDEFDIVSWARYKEFLTDSDIDVVKKLAVIIKLARLIDQSKSCDHIACDVLGDKCILNLIPKEDLKESLACQLDDVKKAIPDFKKAFNKCLQVL
jgi:exopolyphosphatase / guanosine-5'-triphosphate,3'-diphosphate pyrophosphatase